MPNVMAALPNIGRVLYSTPQSLVTAVTPNTGVRCSNAAKTRIPLKFAGVSQTRQRISAASEPKFTILWGHVKKILLLNKSFPIVDTCLSCESTAQQSCAMVPRWRFLWSPYVIGQTIIFLPCNFFLSSFFFPRLISAAVDWMSTILWHMVWP